MMILSSLPTFLNIAKEVFGVGADLYRYVSRLREVARQDAEWTPAQEAEFDRVLNDAGLQEHWQAQKG